MKTTTSYEGIAIEKSYLGEVYFAFVNGKMLRSPKRLAALTFRTPELATKAALKALRAAAKAVAS